VSYARTALSRAHPSPGPFASLSLSIYYTFCRWKIKAFVLTPHRRHPDPVPHAQSRRKQPRLLFLPGLAASLPFRSSTIWSLFLFSNRRFPRARVDSFLPAAGAKAVGCVRADWSGTPHRTWLRRGGSMRLGKGTM
jgi:hypothetical protein